MPKAKRIDAGGADNPAPAKKRKTKTSSEVKARYNKKTYQQYVLSLRKVEDAETIEKIETEKAKGNTTSEAIKNLINH